MALAIAQVRDILLRAGVDGEHLQTAVDEIIAGNVASIDFMREKVAALEEEARQQKKKSEKLSETQKELDDLKAQIAEEAKAREGKDYDKLKEEYDKLTEQFDGYKAEQEKKEAHAAKETAFRGLLKDAEIDRKYFDKIIKYSDIDGIELTDDGKIKNADERLKAVKEEWPEYKVTTRQKGADTAEPPANKGGGMTKEEIEKIKDTTERQRAIAENHELFGF